MILEFKNSATVGLPVGIYCFVITFIPWTDNSGGIVQQIAFVNTKCYRRASSIDWNSWGNWTAIY